MKHSKKMILLAVFMILLAVFSLGCEEKQKKDKDDLVEFSALGMTISLPEGTEETVLTGQTVTYSTENVIVTMMKIPFSKSTDLQDLSAEEFTEMTILSSNLPTGVKLTTEDGIPGFDFEQENPQMNDTYHHFVKIYKGGNAFLMVQFIVPVDQVEEYVDQFAIWAKSVRFD